MKKSLLMPLSLQYFADPEGEGEQEGQGATPATDPNPTGPDNPTDPDKKGEEGKTFTRDDVAKMIAAETNKAIVKAQQEWETNKNEAEEFAKMNEQEKNAKLQEKIAELERQRLLSEMTETASEMLSDKSSKPTKEMLRLIVSEDAETTSSNVKTYLASIEAEREAIKAEFEKRLGGKVPLDGSGTVGVSRGTTMAKEANEQVKKPSIDPWA